MISATVVCEVALALWTAHAPAWFAPRLPAMQSTCEEVAVAADRRGLDRVLLISIAWEESRFRYVESDAGALGPLQALPSLWCPGGTPTGCDLVEAGLDAFEAWSERFNGHRFEAVCHYNGGNVCGRRSLAYADRVLDRYQALLDELVGCHPCGC